MHLAKAIEVKTHTGILKADHVAGSGSPILWVSSTSF